MKIGLLSGGISHERPVSIMSAQACADSLMRRHDVTLIDVTHDIQQLIDDVATPKFDIIFNGLHGRFGEDGAVQSILDWLQLAYTHSGRNASCAAMDKQITRQLAYNAGLDIAQGHVLSAHELQHMIAAPMGYPFIVKPRTDGSSVGVFIVRNNEEWMNARSAWQFGDALIEEYIDGRELTCSILHDEPLGVTELVPNSGFYDYNAKYTAGETIHICPAVINSTLRQKIEEQALKIHHILGCNTLSRSDFRYDSTHDRLVFLETNTQPGMTALSLVPEQALQRNIDFDMLIDMIAQGAKIHSSLG